MVSAAVKELPSNEKIDEALRDWIAWLDSDEAEQVLASVEVQESEDVRWAENARRIEPANLQAPFDL